jgi:alkylhydroperoxidase/carboxymuconolactone decarboxylase family protein YurZ
MNDKRGLGGFAYGMTPEVARAAPKFAEAYRGMVRATETSEVLPGAIRELIGLAVNAAATHLNREAATQHIEHALAEGATDEQIVEVLQLSSALGIHALVHGVPRLVKVAPELIAGDLSPRQQALKDYWLTHRGFWPESFDGVLAGDPEYFEACSDFQNAPIGGVLEPKIRELIFTAIDASTTHMYANVDRHIQLALDHGATPAEVLATLELTALIGVQCFTLGVEALIAVRERIGADARAAG